MLVRTESGSSYLFSFTEKGLVFMKGLSEGRVVTIKGLEVGKRLHIEYYPYNYMGQELTSIGIIDTTPIVSIE